MAEQPDSASRYMPIDEIERGMTGFGRTVVEGTRIDTFEFEVLSVMRNAMEASQDAILIRASGLNLEHSGIVAGMSGSPCYIVDDQGRERLIGAVAFGWAMSKDPICGVQPIGQMIDIAETRDPARRPRRSEPASEGGFESSPPSLGIPIERLAGDSIDQHVRDSRFSFLVDGTPSEAARPVSPTMHNVQTLQPLPIPVAVAGLDARTLNLLQPHFETAGLMLVPSGGEVPDDQKAASEEVILEPGSVLSIPLMSGDLNVDAVGTCTDVIGDKVLGFGHGIFSRGFVELPLATGTIHSVIPSVFLSFKAGASLRTVGTIFGDEQTGIFGLQGEAPPRTPLEVTVRDVRGELDYRYELTRDTRITPTLVLMGVMSSIMNRSDLPEDHTVRYSVRVDFGELGTFRTSNFTSQTGISGLFGDLFVPLSMLMRTPFGQAQVTRAVVEVDVEPQAAAATMHEARLRRNVFRPGETVSVDVQWLNEQAYPTYTRETYAIDLPQDLPDGTYELLIGSAMAHLSSLRERRPYEWYATSLEDILTIMNNVGTVQENRVYMHLKLPDVGVSIGRTPMPNLPSFRQKILADSGRGDVRPFRDAIVVEHETDFVVRGQRTFAIQVERKLAY